MVLTFAGHVYALAVHFVYHYRGVEGVAGCAGRAEYGAIITVLEIAEGLTGYRQIQFIMDFHKLHIQENIQNHVERELSASVVPVCRAHIEEAVYFCSLSCRLASETCPARIPVPRVQKGKGDTYSAFLALAVLTASARVRTGAVASVAGSTATATHFGRLRVRSVELDLRKSYW